MLKRSLPLLMLVATAGCDDDGGTKAKDPFTLRFVAAVDDQAVGCGDTLAGFGPEGTDKVGLSDVRFYVSNLRFLDADGAAVPVVLDENDFQLTTKDGSVALVDLTSNVDGDCGPSAIAFAEGTARTNQVVTGKTDIARVHSVAFDVGVPQALMKATIAVNSAEGAPSPLNEMFWNWNLGYRHVVLNFAVTDADDATGGGYVHLGSIDCGPADGKALEDRASCTYVNTPSVMIADFDPATDTVALDLRKALAGVDFRSPIYDTTTFEVIGEGPGVECHSSPDQPDCPTLFSNFGLAIGSGAADAAADQVFVRLR